MRSFDEEATSIAGLEDSFDAKSLWSLKNSKGPWFKWTSLALLRRGNYSSLLSPPERLPLYWSSLR